MNISLISSYEEENYGIRLLSSCLKEAGHKVSLFFLRNFFLDDYEDCVIDQLLELTARTDLVGISLMTNNFDNAVQITKAYKAKTDKPIVWGGTHPTIRPEESLDYADYVCVGEAEVSILKFIEMLDSGKTRDLSGIRGLGWKNNGKKIINGPGEMVENLDSLPFPDYSLDDQYILVDNTIQRLDLELFETTQHRFYKGAYIAFPTRGCPFSCTYCFNSTFNKMYAKKKIFRKRSPVNVIEELESVINKFSFIDKIIFDDDNFFMQKIEEIETFALMYKKRIGLPLLIAGLSPETVDKAKMSCLVNAGLEEIRLGIQSGSFRVRRMYNRNHSNEKIEEAIKIIYSFKDRLKHMNYDVMLDNPWETEEDIVETIRLLSKIPHPRHLIIYSLTFYPGTPLYERARKEGIINDDRRDVYRKFYSSSGTKRTYLNNLIFLLECDSAKRDIGWLMPLFTNKFARKLKPLWLAKLLRNPALLYYYIDSWLVLFKEGSKAVRKADWKRIVQYLRSRDNLPDDKVS